MKQLHKKLTFLASAVMCASLLGGAFVALSGTQETAIAETALEAETYSFGDLPKNTGASSFGYYDAGHVQYTLKFGAFNESAENYGLQAFDTWDGANKLSSSTASGVVAQNWHWKFGANNSIVAEIKSEIAGSIHFDFSGCTLNGWFDSIHFRFGVYRYNAADKTLDTLVRIANDSTVNAKDNAVYDRTVIVKEGDVIYYEIGQGNNGNNYNLQNQNSAKIVVTPGVEEVVPANPQEFTYLNYPSQMNGNGYSWIKGDVFDTKLYAGTVNNLKEFDTQGSDVNQMYNAELGATYNVRNWRWEIGKDAGVITAYKANADMKLTITNTYMAGGKASNGWTEDTVLTYYLVGENGMKEIKEVKHPQTDADFGGTFYLKKGDILYVEFNAPNIDGGTRNAEAPCGTKVVGDPTAFDAAAYTAQNAYVNYGKIVNAVNSYMSLAYSYTQNGEAFEGSSFRIRFGVDAAVANVAGATAYGIQVTANGKTVTYTTANVSWTVANDVAYVVVDLGDIIGDTAKLGTEFTVAAYAVVGGTTYVSEAVKTYSVATMVAEYYNAGIAEVEHLYNYLNA